MDNLFTIGKDENAVVLFKFLMQLSYVKRRKAFKAINRFNRTIADINVSTTYGRMRLDVAMRLLQSNLAEETVAIRGNEKISKYLRERIVGYYRYMTNKIYVPMEKCAKKKKSMDKEICRSQCLETFLQEKEEDIKWQISSEPAFGFWSSLFSPFLK